MSAQNVLLPSFTPWPIHFFGIAGQDHPFEHAWKARAHTSPAIISWLYGRRGGAILREAADRLFEVLLLTWMQSWELRLICEAIRHMAYALMKYAHYLDSSTEAMLGSIYTIEYWMVNNTECDADLWMYSVVTIIQCCRLFTHTLCVCVERGYIGPSTVPGSWEWGWKFFRFF